MAGSRHVTEKTPFLVGAPAGRAQDTSGSFHRPTSVQGKLKHTLSQIFTQVFVFLSTVKGGLTTVFSRGRCWGLRFSCRRWSAQAGEAEPCLWGARLRQSPRGVPGLVGQQPAHPLPGGTHAGYGGSPACSCTRGPRTARWGPALLLTLVVTAQSPGVSLKESAPWPGMSGVLASHQRR